MVAGITGPGTSEALEQGHYSDRNAEISFLSSTKFDRMRHIQINFSPHFSVILARLTLPLQG